MVDDKSELVSKSEVIRCRFVWRAILWGLNLAVVLNRRSDSIHPVVVIVSDTHHFDGGLEVIRRKQFFVLVLHFTAQQIVEQVFVSGLLLCIQVIICLLVGGHVLLVFGDMSQQHLVVLLLHLVHCFLQVFILLS